MCYTTFLLSSEFTASKTGSRGKKKKNGKLLQCGFYFLLCVLARLLKLSSINLSKELFQSLVQRALPWQLFLCKEHSSSLPNQGPLKQWNIILIQRIWMKMDILNQTSGLKASTKDLQDQRKVIIFFLLIEPSFSSTKVETWRVC